MSDLRVKVAEIAIIYTIGAVGYCALELVWRGYSHWTMTVAGGICFLALYLIDGRTRGLTLIKKSLLSAMVITSVEFAIGCVVNLMLGWRVWDYSDLPFSIMGQVCPAFFLLWFLLSVPTLMLSKTIREKLFG